jgi:HSP20 family protein
MTRPTSALGELDRFGVAAAMDMYETENDLVVLVSLPGMEPDAIQITVAGDLLTIQGELKDDGEQPGRQYFHRERPVGQFTRSVTLPRDVKGADAHAEFDHGVLTLTIPKAEETRPRQISVTGR